MDAEADVVSGSSQRENKRSYKDFLMNVEHSGETGSDSEERSTKIPHKEPNGSPNNMIQHIGSSGSDPELHGAESSGFLPTYPVSVSQDRWTMRGEEENFRDNLLHSCCTAEGSISQRSPSHMLEHWVYLDNQHDMADCHVNRPVSPPVPPVEDRRPSVPITSSVTAITTAVSSMVSPMVSSFMTDTCSPIGSMCSATSSDLDSPQSTSWSPCCSDQDPISAAAHLHLLGESLSLIGQHLQETDKVACISSSLSLLLDSLLCALAPLICLTTQIPELRSCIQHTRASTLENIAYVMPGL